MKNKTLILAIIYSVIFGTHAQAANALEQGFKTPPDSAKPWVYWMWMNGNITKEGITADLEAMKKTGIGGAQMFNLSLSIPPGPVKFLGEDWYALTKHAADEAKRLGLELWLHNCPGWSTSGGPWNTPEHSMQILVSSEKDVSGPGKVSGVLPKPFSRLDCYRDIAVFAVPAAGKIMKDCQPLITSGPEQREAVKLGDGDLDTVEELPFPQPGKPQYFQFAFPEPFSARSFTAVVEGEVSDYQAEIQVSQDGVKFEPVTKISLFVQAGRKLVFGFGFKEVTGRYFRIVFTKASGSPPKIMLAEAEFSADRRMDNWTSKAGYSPFPREPLSGGGVSGGGMIRPSDIIDLSEKMKPDGSFEWDAPAGKWRIIRLGHTSKGYNNGPSPEGGRGPECDKLSAEALDAHWAGYMQKILADTGGTTGGIGGVHLDSFEANNQNWTPEFRAEFKKRRGYDMGPFLPALTGRIVDSVETTERFYWDFRKTIVELFTQNYFGRFTELCRKNGIHSSMEAYGIGNFDDILSGQCADMPMGEFWLGKPFITRIAPISAAHTGNKPVFAAEAFTSQPEFSSWREHPYAMKARGDFMFSAGVNRFVFHTYALQPWTNRLPGMTYGQYGIHFKRTVTWWDEAPAWIDYLSRCQYLLQQGLFVADVGYFVGDNTPNYPKSAEMPAGYKYDLIHPVILAQMNVADGRLRLPHGMSYRLLVLSESARTMTLETSRKIRDLVAQGATVLGPKPLHTPGLAGFPDSEVELKKIADEVWGPCDGKTVFENKFGKGRVFCGKDMTDVLAAIDCKPDFSKKSEADIYTIHRNTGEADIYFVAANSDKPLLVECTFRVAGKEPEFFHPDTGKIERCALWSEKDGQITVPINFDPAGSVFVVFRKKAGDHLVDIQTAGAAKTPAVLATAAGCDVIATEPGSFTLTAASGKKTSIRVESVPAPVVLAGPWDVSFAPGWGAPEHTVFDKLISWPEHSDPGIKYFSGTAMYRKTFSISADCISKNRKLFLDLGEVQVIAHVWLNGKDLGTLWKPPFRVDISDAAKSGENALEVKAVNLWPNRLIGDEQFPADCVFETNGGIKAWPAWLTNGLPRPEPRRLTFTTWKHWKKDDKLLPSGLLGPVTIQAAEVKKIEL